MHLSANNSRSNRGTCKQHKLTWKNEDTHHCSCCLGRNISLLQLWYSILTQDVPVGSWLPCLLSRKKKKIKPPDFSATVCKYFPSLIYLPVFNPLVLTEWSHMLISPECSNCTKAISEGKTGPHIHQFLPVRTRGVRKTRWFSVLLLLQFWAGSRWKLLHTPGSHQDPHQHDCSIPAKAGKSQSPSFASRYAPSPSSHGFRQAEGAASGHLPASLHGQSSPFCTAALSSTRSLRIQPAIFVPSILADGHRI